MASISLQCVYRQARQLSSRSHKLVAHSTSVQQLAPRIDRRPITHTSIRRDADKPGTDKESSTSDTKDQDHTPHFNRQVFDALTIDAQNDYLKADAPTRREIDSEHSMWDDELARDSPSDKHIRAQMKTSLQELASEEGIRRSKPTPITTPPTKPGLFARKAEKNDLGPDAEWRHDDIASVGHAELEQHRELREMYRTAAWEMPLLANLKVPYTPPARATQPLKFRYTTYLGEHHPAARKVVVEFNPRHLQLSDAQTDKLLKLLGPRYNPYKNVARMSCESHETQAQNKRALGATIAELIRSCRGQTEEGSDMFEDVPFDFRHARSRPKPKFPEAWKVDARRAEELGRIREGRKAALEAPVENVETSPELETVPAGARQYR